MKVAGYEDDRIGLDLKSQLMVKDCFHIMAYKCGIILT